MSNSFGERMMGQNHTSPQHGQQSQLGPQGQHRLRHVLIFDPDPVRRDRVLSILSAADYQVDPTSTVEDALQRLAVRNVADREEETEGRGQVDLVLTRLESSPGTQGSLVERMHKIAPSLPIVLMTHEGEMEKAAEAMSRGATDYLVQPELKEMLLLVVEKALRQRRLEEEVQSLRAPVGADFTLPADGIVLSELERTLIAQALERSRGTLGPAAALLGITYKTLQYRIRKYEIDREAYANLGEPSPSSPSPSRANHPLNGGLKLADKVAPVVGHVGHTTNRSMGFEARH